MSQFYTMNADEYDEMHERQGADWEEDESESEESESESSTSETVLINDHGDIMPLQG